MFVGFVCVGVKIEKSLVIGFLKTIADQHMWLHVLEKSLHVLETGLYVQQIAHLRDATADLMVIVGFAE